ncbi:MAG: hypothetical protein P8L37_04715, partial [Phycisphaerales bacterium]|nr:hypothetical protein [Phycisphaerales bacterium]
MEHIHEERLLAWVEGALDPADARILETELKSNPELFNRLKAMRDDRAKIGALPEPPPPPDLLQRVEMAMTRPMLAIPPDSVPGRFRRRKHRSEVRVLLQSRFRMAALIIVGIGLFSALLLFNPFAGMFSSSDNARRPASAGDMSDWLAVGKGAPAASVAPPQTVAPGDVAILPEPLAMVLGSDADALAMLRELTLQVDGTLVRNASAADFNESGLGASADTQSIHDGGFDLEPTLLLGDADQSPSFDDQFLYAASGAIYTIAVPLSRLDALLLALDERAGTDASVLL